MLPAGLCCFWQQHMRMYASKGYEVDEIGVLSAASLWATLGLRLFQDTVMHFRWRQCYAEFTSSQQALQRHEACMLSIAAAHVRAYQMLRGFGIQSMNIRRPALQAVALPGNARLAHRGLCGALPVPAAQTHQLVLVLLVEHDALELGLEPLDGVVLGHLVLHAHAGKPLPPLGHAVARAVQHHVEVHACASTQTASGRLHR